MRNVSLFSPVGLRRMVVFGCSAGLGAALLVSPAQAQVTGAEEIAQKYDQWGGASSPLGGPKGDARPVAGGGAVRDYDGGAIYYSPPTGAHVLYGDILADYERLGGPMSGLGFPTTDEVVTPGDTGRFNDFSAPDGASIYWVPRDAWVVRGPMLAAYRKLGGPATELGLPAAAAVTDPDGTIRQKFSGDNGAAEISWNPKHGFGTAPGGLAAGLAGLSFPGMNAALPEGSVRLPDGNVQFPDGSIKLPDGSFQLPNGNTVLPDGSIELPDGSISLPEGAVRLPDGSLQYANGLIRLPDGAFKLPEGAVQLPDGTVRMPDGSITFPSGAVKLPDGSFQLPSLSAPSVEKSQGWFAKFKDKLGWWWLLALLAVAAALIGLLGLLWWAWNKLRGGGRGGSGHSGVGTDVRGPAVQAPVVGARSPVMEQSPTLDMKGAAASLQGAGMTGVAQQAGGTVAGAHAGISGLGRRAGLAGTAAAGTAAAGMAVAGARKRMTGASAITEPSTIISRLTGTEALDMTYAEAVQGLSPTVVGVKLLVDENLSPRIAEKLEAAGYDVVHLRDVGSQNGDNRRVLAQAKSLGRALVTAERAYADDLAAASSAPSVVVLRHAEATADDQVVALRQALPRLDQLLSSGALVVLSDRRIRAWRFPLPRG
ncbi:DUF5615 family PIN-like protein [Nocardia tengchongensis]|uniref:DUF5615 family PIN-like protein n=1 Tax=Nocardia tengchongensis TaxID=2055889 RepID=UPI00361CF871